MNHAFVPYSVFMLAIIKSVMMTLTTHMGAGGVGYCVVSYCSVSRLTTNHYLLCTTGKSGVNLSSSRNEKMKAATDNDA
jgi:hypothetical protein